MGVYSTSSNRWLLQRRWWIGHRRAWRCRPPKREATKRRFTPAGRSDFAARCWQTATSGASAASLARPWPSGPELDAHVVNYADDFAFICCRPGNASAAMSADGDVDDAAWVGGERQQRPRIARLPEESFPDFLQGIRSGRFHGKNGHPYIDEHSGRRREVSKEPTQTYPPTRTTRCSGMRMTLKARFARISSMLRGCSAATLTRGWFITADRYDPHPQIHPRC